jgi:hypothetical protein
LKNDGFHYQRKTLNIEREESLDGIYVIRTSVKSEALSSQQVVATYKSLSGVERAFPSLKTVDLQVRPIHHRLPDRVRAHILLCMLAYYVEMIINKRAHRARIPRRQTETNSQSPSARALARVWLGRRGALQHLSRGGRAALAEQFHAGGVPGMHVLRLRCRGSRLLAGRAAGLVAWLLAGPRRNVFGVRGIPAAAWFF